MMCNSNNSNNIRRTPPRPPRPPGAELLPNKPHKPRKDSFYNRYSSSSSSKTPDTTSGGHSRPPPAYRPLSLERYGTSGSSTPGERRRAGHTSGQGTPRPISRSKSTDTINRPQDSGVSQQLYPQYMSRVTGTLTVTSETNKFGTSHYKERNVRNYDQSTERTAASVSSRYSQHQFHTRDLQTDSRQSRSRERPQSPRLKRSQSLHQTSLHSTTQNTATTTCEASLTPLNPVRQESQVGQTQPRSSVGTPTRDRRVYQGITTKDLKRAENQSVDQNEQRHLQFPKASTDSKTTSKQNHTTLPCTDGTNSPALHCSHNTTSRSFSSSTAGPGAGTGSETSRCPSPEKQRPSSRTSRTSGRETSCHTPITSHTSVKETSCHTLAARGVAEFPESGGRVGISNLGNTCFMNSMLQCLGQTGEMARIFLEMTPTPPQGLIRAYRELMQQMWKEGSTPYTTSSLYPRALRDAFSHKNPQFSGFNQHDSQEFMRFLVSGLHEELKRPCSTKPDIPQDEDAGKWWKWYRELENSSLLNVFVGQLCSSLTCVTCKHCSLTIDPFWELSISLPKRSSNHTMAAYSFSRGTAYNESSYAPVQLEECLDIFTRKENLDGDERPYCDKCQSQQPCVKKMSICRLPQVLVIHLKRFSGYGRRSKLDTSVIIPHTLDISKYVTETLLSTNTGYELYAVSNHSGTVYFGHYTAWCKHYSSSKWFSYNDSHVSEVRVPTPTFSSSTAYVLFYRFNKKISRI